MVPPPRCGRWCRAGRGLKVAAQRAGSFMQIRGGAFLRPPAGGRGACFGGGGHLGWGSGLACIFCYLFFRQYPPPPINLVGSSLGAATVQPPHPAFLIVFSSLSTPNPHLPILIPPFPSFPHPQLQQPRVGERGLHLFKTKILGSSSQRLSGTSPPCRQGTVLSGEGSDLRGAQHEEFWPLLHS